jgi:hypothetical protein
MSLYCRFVGFGISWAPEDKRMNPMKQSDYGAHPMLFAGSPESEEFDILTHGHFSKTDISVSYRNACAMLLASFSCSQMGPVICSIKEG